MPNAPGLLQCNQPLFDRSRVSLRASLPTALHHDRPDTRLDDWLQVMIVASKIKAHCFMPRKSGSWCPDNYLYIYICTYIKYHILHKYIYIYMYICNIYIYIIHTHIYIMFRDWGSLNSLPNVICVLVKAEELISCTVHSGSFAWHRGAWCPACVQIAEAMQCRLDLETWR